MRPNPFLSPDMLENLSTPTDAEIAAFWRMNPRLADDMNLPPIAYDNGIEPDAALLRAG